MLHPILVIDVAKARQSELLKAVTAYRLPKEAKPDHSETEASFLLRIAHLVSSIGF